MKNKPFPNRLPGIGIMSAGIIFSSLNIYLIYYQNKFLPKLFATGIILFWIGIALSLFPGAKIDGYSGTQYWKLKWKNTSQIDKAIWVISSIIGIINVVLVFDYFHLSFA